MTEDEIKAALSIEIKERSDMCSEWIEVRLFWYKEVISVSTMDYPSDID